MYHVTLSFTPMNGRLEGRFVTARGLHGLLFHVLRRADAGEANWLHKHRTPKPFSLAPFYTEEGALVGLRLAAVTERAADLLAGAWEGVHGSQELLRLGRQEFAVSDVTYTPGPGFAALANAPPGRELALRFLSPTAFKQGPGHLRFPLPANVFAWPFRVWQTFAPRPLALPENWLSWCEQDVFVLEHRIETATVAISKSEQFTGFVGEALFQTEPAPELYLRVFQALGALAAFTGVGHKTTMGMGAVEVISEQWTVNSGQ